MQNTTQEPYSDSPADSQSTCSPSSSNASTIKPLPALSDAEVAPLYSNDEPYYDEPPSPSNAAPSARTPHHPHHIQLPYQPYTDASAPPTPSDEDVPLAHLLLQPRPQLLDAQDFYPLEAPPSYSVAVRQAYRETLLHYVPGTLYIPRDAVADEEAGVETAGAAEDVSHSIENVVAMFVVASLLLIISAVMGWLAIGSGLFS